jgi:hypothetical protein
MCDLSRWSAGVAGSNPIDGMDGSSGGFVVCCVGSGICDGLITDSNDSLNGCLCVSNSEAA